MITILLVDDMPDLLEITRIFLEKEGDLAVDTAMSAEEAFRMLHERKYDAVVSDYNMPEMDGLALLRAVRSHPVVRKVPFILLTGRGDRELVVKAAEAGVNNYLVKPFTAAILREKIEQVMGKLS